MRRVWGHFRRGSDEELPSFEEAIEADARLRGAARLAVLDAARRQRRSARAFRSWNASTVAKAVADAEAKRHAVALRAKDGENARKISEALSEAYAGHAAELAAQAREHEEAKYTKRPNRGIGLGIFLFGDYCCDFIINVFRCILFRFIVIHYL